MATSKKQNYEKLGYWCKESECFWNVQQSKNRKDVFVLKFSKIFCMIKFLNI